MPSCRSHRLVLSCSVLRYLTSQRMRSISLDQLDYGLHNPGASQKAGPSLAWACAGGTRLCPPLPNWVSLTLDGTWRRLPLTPAQTTEGQPKSGREVAGGDGAPVIPLKMLGKRGWWTGLWHLMSEISKNQSIWIHADTDILWKNQPDKIWNLAWITGGTRYALKTGKKVPRAAPLSVTWRSTLRIGCTPSLQTSRLLRVKNLQAICGGCVLALPGVGRVGDGWRKRHARHIPVPQRGSTAWLHRKNCLGPVLEPPSSNNYHWEQRNDFVFDMGTWLEQAATHVALLLKLSNTEGGLCADKEKEPIMLHKRCGGGKLDQFRLFFWFCHSLLKFYKIIFVPARGGTSHVETCRSPWVKATVLMGWCGRSAGTRLHVFHPNFPQHMATTLLCWHRSAGVTVVHLWTHLWNRGLCTAMLHDTFAHTLDTHALTACCCLERMCCWMKEPPCILLTCVCVCVWVVGHAWAGRLSTLRAMTECFLTVPANRLAAHTAGRVTMILRWQDQDILFSVVLSLYI